MESQLQNITAEWPVPVSGIMRQEGRQEYIPAHKKRILHGRKGNHLEFLVGLKMKISALSANTRDLFIVFTTQ